MRIYNKVKALTFLLLFIFLNFNIGYAFYLDPNLKKLILDAIKNSSYIQSLKFSLDAYKLDEVLSKKSKGPNLDLSSSLSLFQFQHTFKPVSNSDLSTALSLNLILNYILYDPNYSLNMKNAKITYKSKQLSYLKEKLNIEYTFIDLYLEFLKTKELLKLEKENLNLSKKIYSLALEKYKAGIISQEDIINYLIFLKDNQKSLYDLEVQLKNLKERLSYYLKGKDIPIISLQNLPERINIKPVNLDEKNIKYSILIKNISIKKLKNKFKPVIKLSSSINLNSAVDLENLDWDNSNIFVSSSIGISLFMPIFDNYQTKYEILKAKKETLSLEKKLKDIRDSFHLNLKEKWNIYESKKQNFILQKKITKLYEEIFSIKKEKFQQGQASLQDVLDAQKNLLASRKNEILTFYQTWNNFFNYLKTANIDLLNL